MKQALRWKRAGTVAACLAALLRASASSADAGQRDIEIDLRDSIYLFGVPSGYLGPFNSKKLDVAAPGTTGVLLLHAVWANRIDPLGGAHGTFVRFEDDHRLGSSTIRVAAGVGGGVLGERSATLAFVQPVAHNRRVSLSAAIDLTSLTPATYQRVVGIGPEAAIGRVDVFARYYHASTTNATNVPASASILASAPVSHAVGLALAANFGGELNADRTSGFLPTSSGRFGTDLSFAVRLRMNSRTGILTAYEAAVYRGTPSGELARIQHIITAGVWLSPFSR